MTTIESISSKIQQLYDSLPNMATLDQGMTVMTEIQRLIEDGKCASSDIVADAVKGLF